MFVKGRGYRSLCSYYLFPFHFNYPLIYFPYSSHPCPCIKLFALNTATYIAKFNKSQILINLISNLVLQITDFIYKSNSILFFPVYKFGNVINYGYNTGIAW